MKKRGLTAGITSCGGGVGGAVWSIVSPLKEGHLGSRLTVRDPMLGD